MADPLEICGVVNQKLRMGDSITDSELATARKHYRPIVAFLRKLNDRKFDLFTDYLDSDLQRLDSYHESRKRHKNER